MRRATRLAAAIGCACSGEALAHAELSAVDASLTWTWEPWVVALIVASAFLYARGVRTLWRRAGVSQGIRRAEAASFGAGLATVIVALVSPLDALGAQLFAAHMTQHELLMLVAAPLLVMGRPLAPWLWALPYRWRRSLGAATRTRALSAAWTAITTPTLAWIQHAVVIWTWHAPTLFDAALANRGIHTLQHLSFLVSALLFWWALLPRPGALQAGSVGLYLFTTMLHTGALGALLTFSSRVWYLPYAQTTLDWGLTPLEDQQLGGLIMWIPAGAVYAGVGLALLGRWLRLPRSAPIPWETSGVGGELHSNRRCSSGRPRHLLHNRLIDRCL